jgi:hypothetical protein
VPSQKPITPVSPSTVAFSKSRRTAFQPQHVCMLVRDDQSITVLFCFDVVVHEAPSCS